MNTKLFSVRSLAACLVVALATASANAMEVLRLEAVGLDVTTEQTLTSNTGNPLQPVSDYSGTLTAVDKVSTQLMALELGSSNLAVIAPLFSLPTGMALNHIEIIADIELGNVTGGSLNISADNNGNTEIVSADLLSGQLLYDAGGVDGNTVHYLLSADLDNIAITDDLANALTTFLGLDVPSPGQLLGNLFEFRFSVTDGQYPVTANAKVDIYNNPTPPPPPSVVPLPAPASMGMVLLTGMGLAYIRRRQRAALATID